MPCASQCVPHMGDRKAISLLICVYLRLVSLAISPLRPKIIFFTNHEKIAFFFGKKLDAGCLTRYYLIMGIVEIFKLKSPLPLSKIYPIIQPQVNR